MAHRLRVARVGLGRYRPLAGFVPDGVRHRVLDGLIRRHLPAVTASLLAQPSASGEGGFVDWYTDLAGQPVALAALGGAPAAEARARLADRLDSLNGLADRLEASDPEGAGLLRAALSFPGEETVYVVGGQPVITFWGHQPLAVPPATASPPVAAASPPVTTASASPSPLAAAGSEGGRRGLWLGLALLVLVGLAGLGWLTFGGGRWPPWGPDFAALLAVAKEEEAALARRLAEHEVALTERLAYCAAEQALLAAQGEEERLQALLAGTQGRLAERLALCPLTHQLGEAAAQGQALQQRLDQLAADLTATLSDCRRKEEEAKRKIAEEQEERARREELARTSACVTAEGDVPPLDIYFLQDLTGSFHDDLPNMTRMVGNLVARAESGTFGPDVRFGLGSFMDKPHPLFGARRTYVFNNHLNLTGDGGALLAAIRGLRVLQGGDRPEAQYEALIEMVANAERIGFRKNARRFVVLLTDAEPHVAGDWAPGGLVGAPRPSSGRGGAGPLDEDYPSPEQVMAALRSARITPIFLVSGPSIVVYQAFVNALGQGVSRPLSPDSANVFDALLAGLKQACKQ